MPRFVLLYHDCPPHFERPSHWDLMLEAGEMLRTWALPRLPRDWRSWQARTALLRPECAAVNEENVVDAQQLSDHRLDYLQLEGPLSGDRGSVVRIERGAYSDESEDPGCWQVTLTGSEWNGRVTLRQIKAGSEHWTLTVEAS